MSDWLNVVKSIFFITKVFVFIFLPLAWVSGIFFIWNYLQLWHLDTDLVYSRDFNIEVLYGTFPALYGMLAGMVAGAIYYILFAFIDKYIALTRRFKSMRKLNYRLLKYSYSSKTKSPEPYESTQGTIIPLLVVAVFICIMTSMLTTMIDSKRLFKENYQQIMDKKTTVLTALPSAKGKPHQPIHIIQCGKLCGVYFLDSNVVGYMKSEDMVNFAMMNKSSHPQKIKVK
jgi:hypothetical protein